MMKVLAAIVAPPHLTVSGGARAGEMLSAALASSCDMTVANMMGVSPQFDAPIDGRRPARAAVRYTLPRLLRGAPMMARYRALFYRSNIPQIVSHGSFDLVHLHNPMPALEMARVAAACAAAGTPYVVSTHGFNEIANGRRIYGFGALRGALWKRLVEDSVARVVRGAAAVFALSPADFEIVRAMGYRGAVHIVPNGVRAPSAADAIEDARTLQRFGIPAVREPDLTTFMFLANHTPNKGLPTLFAAFARIKEPYRLIVGGEKREGVDYEGAVGVCGPRQSVVITGQLRDEEVAALFRRSDIFVFPTSADTFPLVVLEAMSHALPVVSSDVGGIPYQLSEGCGVLTPPGDVAALTAALETLARDPAARSAMGRLAKQRVDREFTWESAAALALAAYDQALSRRPQANPVVVVRPRHAR